MRYLISLLLLVGLNVFAANFVSTQTGLFSAGTTWVGGTAPTASGDTWTIAAGHTVTYDTDNSGHAVGWGATTNSGTLAFTNGTYAWLKLATNMAGTGAIMCGTDDAPIGFSSSNTPMVVIEGVNVGRFSTSGNVQFIGDTNQSQFYTSTNQVNIGASTIELDRVPSGITSNAVFFFSYTNSAAAGRANQFYVVRAVTNNVLYLETSLAQIATITNTWYGAYCLLTNIAVNTYARTGPAAVVFAHQPIVFLEKTQRSSGNTISGGTNGLIVGCRVQNLGVGLANARIGFTINNSSANSCNNGGFANNLCSGFTINNSSANSCSGGGFAYNYCVGFTINNSSANSCANGGFDRGGLLHRLYASTNTSSYSFYASVGGSTMFECGGSLSQYQSSKGAQYNAFIYDNNYWITDYGNATNTGTGYEFTPTNSTGPVFASTVISVRPNATRTITFRALSTNNITYGAGVVWGQVYPPNPITFCTGVSGAYTNYTITLTNSTQMPNQATVILTAQGTNYGFGNYYLNADESVVKQ